MGIILIDEELKATIAAAIERAKAKPVDVEKLRDGALALDTIISRLEDRDPDFKRPESEHVILGTYRASISFEQQPAGLARHLSISTLQPGKVPDRPTCDQIAMLFGI